MLEELHQHLVCAAVDCVREDGVIAGFEHGREGVRDRRHAYVQRSLTSMDDHFRVTD